MTPPPARRVAREGKAHTRAKRNGVVRDADLILANGAAGCVALIAMLEGAALKRIATLRNQRPRMLLRLLKCCSDEWLSSTYRQANP